MNPVLKQIGKHSSIYMLSQIVTNSLSVVMLPVYLRYYTPKDFGCTAVIDFTISLLIAALASGIISALSRLHFSAKSAEEQRTIWWSGLFFVTCTISIGAIGFGLLATQFSQFRLEEEIAQAPLWIRLASFSLWLDIQTTVIVSYLRARKRSATIMTLTIFRSLIFVACAITGIVFFKLGPTGQFLANVIASSIMLVALYTVVLRDWKWPHASWAVCLELWHYGWPLFMIGVLMALMNQLNRWFLTLEHIGLLTLGLKVTEIVNRLIVMPFQQIWGMLIYELHEEQPDEAIRTYSLVFELFCYVLISVFFGCSIAAGPALMLIAKPDYLPSVPLIPILCLAQFFLAISDQFQVPMRLSKQTYLMLPAALTGVIIAGTCNWFLIPIFGTFGAAWATVATYFSFSAVNLFVARQLAVHPYPFRRIGLVLTGVCATFLIHRFLTPYFSAQWLSLGIGLSFWFVWTLLMAAVSYRRMRKSAGQPPPAKTDSQLEVLRV